LDVNLDENFNDKGLDRSLLSNMSSRDIDEDSEFDTSNDGRAIISGYRAPIPETLQQDLSLRSPDLLDDDDDRNTLNPQKRPWER